MKFSVPSRKVIILASIGLIVFFVATFLTHASTSSVSNLSIDPLTAVYTEGDRGYSLHIVFAIVNSGETDATIVTKHLDFGRYGIDEDTNSLKCTLSFDDPLKYKDKYLSIPSIYDYCPVTLKHDEMTMVNYYAEYPKNANFKGWDKKVLQAGNIVITYKISSFWADRFGLWYGELHSAPVKFTKRASDVSIQDAH
jgi:hypothetical protein